MAITDSSRGKRFFRCSRVSGFLLNLAVASQKDARRKASFFDLMSIEPDHHRLTVEGHPVTRFEFFLTTSFHQAVQLHFTTLDDQLGLSTGTHHAGQLHELIELNGWFSGFHRISYRWWEALFPKPALVP